MTQRGTIPPRRRGRERPSPARPTSSARNTWEREGLSKRDRSLVTISALTALGKTDQLQFHLAFARRNGVTDEPLKEALLHLAFYAGWPNGMCATTVLKNIIESES